MANICVTDLLNEIKNQAKPPTIKPKIQAKDYTRENILRIRQLSATTRNEKQTSNKLKSVTDVNRILPDKYAHVQAKVSTFNTSTSRPSTVAGSKKPPLYLNEENQKQNQNQKNFSQKLTRPPSVPKLQLSYVKENANNAKFTRLKRCSSASDLDDKKSKYLPGFVPKYLIERKKQLLLEKEKEAERAKAEFVPEGHILMPDNDRLETLKLMKQSEDELIQRLSSLPVCLGTLRLTKEKEQIEQQLAKLEEGIKIFSRSKVYIKNDV